MNNRPSRIKNSRALAWLFVLVVGIGAGYHMLKEAVTERPFDNPPWLAIGVIFISILALLLSQQEKETKGERTTSKIPSRLYKWMRTVERYLRMAAVILAALLLAYLLTRIPSMILPSDSFTGLLFVWSMAFGLYLWGVTAPMTRQRRDWAHWWALNKRQVAAASGLMILALMLRVWRLETIPFTLGGDEGSQGLEAVRVLEGQLRNPFATGWLGVPTMSFFFNSITIKLLGQTIVGLRLPWALVGTTAVLVTFLLVKRLKNNLMAFVIAFLVATYHYHIHFSRLGSNQIADPFFMALSLLFLYRALDEHRWLDWALAGGVVGLAFYFYAGARLTAVVILAVLAYEFIRQPRHFWQQHRLGLVILLGGFFVVGGPIIQYALRFPNDFNARINAVGIIQSGWLEQEVIIRQENMATILFDQFRRAALAFNYYRDRTVWYGLRQPFLDPFFGVFFLLGLGVSTLRLWGKTADSRSAPMVAWWWGGMILGGLLTESPPSSQRLITLSIPTCFFIGMALSDLTQLIRKSLWDIPTKAIMALGALLFASLSIFTYFADYSPQRIYGGPHAELATEIVPQLRELAPDHRIYFVGAPTMYWGFATLPYLVPEADALDITKNFAEPTTWDSVILDKDAVFVIIPQRANELDLIQHSLPGGEVVNYFSPVNGRPLVTLYRVPSALP